MNTKMSSLNAQFTQNAQQMPPPPAPRPPIQLTEEQRERMRKNREEALKRKAAAEERQRLQQQQQQMATTNSAGSTAKGPMAQAVAAPIRVPPPKLITAPPKPTTHQPQQPNRPPQPVAAPPNRPQFPAHQSKQPPQQPRPNVPTAGGQQPMQFGGTNAVSFWFSLCDSARFKLRFDPFKPLIADKLREVPSRNFNPDDRSWTFALKDYEAVKRKIADLQTMGLKPGVDEIPFGVRKLFLDKISPIDAQPSNTNSKTELNRVDARLRDMLFPFQRRGVSFGIQRNGRLLIADEMGLGKTVQALAIASAYRGEWPLLIVCPSSVKYMWSKQVKRFLPDTRPTVIEKSKDMLPKSRATNVVVLMSYHMMDLIQQDLRQQGFYVIIFDESHMLKEPKSKRTKVADELAKRANRVLLLSGTPALSRPIELFTQIRMINPTIMTNYKQYAVRYCDGKMGRFGFEAKGQSNAEELKTVMDKIMIRRLKKDVLEDLPEKRREIIFLSGDAIDLKMKQYLAELKMAKEEFEQTNRYSRDNKAKETTFMDYYRLTGKAKVNAVAKHVLDTYFYEDAPEKKLLIFAHHHDVLDQLGLDMAKNGIKYIRIDGTTSALDRQQHCDQFQTDRKTRVAILSITAAGIGITLTAASVVVFAELYWNPSLMIQAEDRAHRVGQRDSVHVIYMLARKSADMEIWEMIRSKLEVLGSVNLANENYDDANTSDKLCPDNQLITDFFTLLMRNEPSTSEDDGSLNEQQQQKNGVPKPFSSSIISAAPIITRPTTSKFIGSGEPAQKRVRNSDELDELVEKIEAEEEENQHLADKVKEEIEEWDEPGIED